MKKRIIIFISLIATFYLLFADDGIIKWSKTYNNSDGDQEACATSSIETSDGNYLVTGLLYLQVGFDWFTKHSWILKLDAYGDTLWTEIYLTNPFVNGAAGDVVETPEGDYIIAGNENGGYLIKMDTDGNRIDEKRYEHCGGFGEIVKTSDGNYATVTYYPSGLFKFNNDLDSIWFTNADKVETWSLSSVTEFDSGFIAVGDYTDTQQGTDPRIVKFDKNGTITKTISFTDTTSSSAFFGICKSSDSNFITSGYYREHDTFKRKARVLKINSDLDVVWEKYYSVDEPTSVFGLCSTYDDCFAIAGQGQDSSKAFILKIDQNGDSLWVNKHTTYWNGYSMGGFPFDITETSDNGLLVVGQSGLYSDLWALKLNEYGEVGIEIDNGQFTIDNYKLEQNYPNPFNNQTTIEYVLDKLSDVKILVFNSTGQKVSELVNNKMEKGKYSVIFDASRLNSGVYYYQIEINGKIAGNKKMIYLK